MKIMLILMLTHGHGVEPVAHPMAMFDKAQDCYDISIGFEAPPYLFKADPSNLRMGRTQFSTCIGLDEASEQAIAEIQSFNKGDDQ